MYLVVLDLFEPSLLLKVIYIIVKTLNHITLYEHYVFYSVQAELVRW